MKKPAIPFLILGIALMSILNCSNLSKSNAQEKDNMLSKKDTIIKKKKHTDINQFWIEFKKAYLNNDINTLTELIKLPIRENLFPDIPMHTLKSFLDETPNMKLYDLESLNPKKKSKT